MSLSLYRYREAVHHGQYDRLLGHTGTGGSVDYKIYTTVQASHDGILSMSEKPAVNDSQFTVFSVGLALGFSPSV